MPTLFCPKVGDLCLGSSCAAYTHPLRLTGGGRCLEYQRSDTFDPYPPAVTPAPQEEPTPFHLRYGPADGWVQVPPTPTPTPTPTPAAKPAKPRAKPEPDLRYVVFVISQPDRRPLDWWHLTTRLADAAPMFDRLFEELGGRWVPSDLDYWGPDLLAWGRETEDSRHLHCMGRLPLGAQELFATALAELFSDLSPQPLIRARYRYGSPTLAPSELARRGLLTTESTVAPGDLPGGWEAETPSVIPAGVDLSCPPLCPPPTAPETEGSSAA